MDIFKSYLAITAIVVILQPQCKAQQYVSSQIKALEIQYVQAVQNAFKSIETIPNQGLINELNQPIYANTDSLVQQFYFEPFQQKGNSSSTFRSDYGVDISYLTDSRMMFHGRFYNNSKNNPDSVVIRLTGTCAQENANIKLSFAYNAESMLERSDYKYNFWANQTPYPSDCSMVYQALMEFDNPQQTYRKYAYDETGKLTMVEDGINRLFYKYDTDINKSQVERADSLLHNGWSGPILDQYSNQIEFDSYGRVTTWAKDLKNKTTNTWSPISQDTYHYLGLTDQDYVRKFDAYIIGADQWQTIRRDTSIYYPEEKLIVRKYYAINPQTLDWHCISVVKQYISKPITSVKKHYQNDIELTVYPNPCNSGLMYVKTPLTHTFTHVEIVALSGVCALERQVYQKENERIEIDVNNLKNGMYILILTTKEGEKTQQKLIINK